MKSQLSLFLKKASAALLVCGIIATTGCRARISNLTSRDPAVAVGAEEIAAIWRQKDGESGYALHGTVLPGMEHVTRLTSASSTLNYPRIVATGPEFFASWTSNDRTGANTLFGAFLVSERLLNPFGSFPITDSDHPIPRLAVLPYDTAYLESSDRVLVVWNGLIDAAYDTRRLYYRWVSRSSHGAEGTRQSLRPGGGSGGSPRIAVGEEKILVTYITGSRGTGDTRFTQVRGAMITIADGSISEFEVTPLLRGDPYPLYREAVPGYDPVRDRFLVAMDRRDEIVARFVDESGTVGSQSTLVTGRVFGTLSTHVPLLLAHSEDRDGYLLGYYAIAPESGWRNALFTQRLDSDGVPVGGRVRRGNRNELQGSGELEAGELEAWRERFFNVYEEGELTTLPSGRKQLNEDSLRVYFDGYSD